MTQVRESCITLFTDASSCSKTKIATWSAWAKYRPTDATMRTSGQVTADNERDVVDMVYCESYAITAGVKAAIKLYSPPHGTLIVIQTDNEATTSLITGRGKPRFRDRYRHAIELFDEAIASGQLRTSVKLVTGHKGTVTARNAVNTWCDRECRTLLRGLRKTAQARTATEQLAET